MESARPPSPPATFPTVSHACSERVIDLAFRVRAAHTAAREFLKRYAIEAACASIQPLDAGGRLVGVARGVSGDDLR